jgi:hypothetical protein
MQSLMPWSERRWSFDLPVGAFLAVVERLAGTPARAAALLQGVHEEVLGTSIACQRSFDYIANVSLVSS